MNLASLQGVSQSSQQPAPITGAGQTSGMDFPALGRWHLDYGLEVGLAGLDLQLGFDLGGLSNPNSMMVMITIRIVEKNNLFLKREIHDGLLGVGEEANVVGVVLIEFSLNCFLIVSSEQQILECGCTPKFYLLEPHG